MKIFNQIEIRNLDNREFYKYCQFIGKNSRMWKNRFVALLPEVARRGIHKKHGFATIVKFAAVVGGVGKRTVEAVFQVERHIEDKPALKEILPNVGVNKMRVIATIATKENQEELAEKVQTMPQSVLELVARDYRNKVEEERLSKLDGEKEGEISQIPRARDLQNERVVMKFDVDKKVRLELEKFRMMVEKEKKEALTWEEVMKELLTRATVPKKQYKQKTSKSKSRQTPESKKREETEKYNGKCAISECNAAATEFHHPDRYALNPSHERVVPLCKTHHQAAHYGLIKNEDLSPEYWEIDAKSKAKNHIDKKFQQKLMAYLL